MKQIAIVQMSVLKRGFWGYGLKRGVFGKWCEVKVDEYLHVRQLSIARIYVGAGLASVC